MLASLHSNNCTADVWPWAIQLMTKGVVTGVTLHFSPFSPGRKHCQWQCGSSRSSSVNWTFFLTVFLHFSEVNRPLRDIVVGTRLWLWGKGIIGKLTHFACFWIGSPCLKCLCYKTSVQHSNRASKKKLQHFLPLFQQFKLYLTSLASVSFACVGVGEPVFCCVLPFPCAFYFYLRELLFPQEDLEILAHWALNTCFCCSPWGTEGFSPLSVQRFVEPRPMRSQK